MAPAPVVPTSPTLEQLQDAALSMDLINAAKAKPSRAKLVWEITVKPPEGASYRLHSPIKDKIRSKAKRLADRDGYEVDGPYRVNPYTHERLPSVDDMKKNFNERLAKIEEISKKHSDQSQKDAERKAALDVAAKTVDTPPTVLARTDTENMTVPIHSGLPEEGQYKAGSPPQK